MAKKVVPVQEESYTEESANAVKENPGISYTNGNSHTVSDTQIPPVITEPPENLKVYVTEYSGITLKLNSVSPLLIAKAQQALKNPSPPRYKVELAGGAEQWHDYDETSIQEEDTTPEDKKAWLDFIEKRNEINATRSNKIMELLMAKGVEFEMPSDENWIEFQEELGVVVPEGNLARKVHYLQTEILTSGKDVEEVMGRLMAMTGIGNQALNEVRGLFRLSVQRKAAERLETQGTAG